MKQLDRWVVLELLSRVEAIEVHLGLRKEEHKMAVKRRSGRRRKREQKIDLTRLHECSDTELVQIARAIGFNGAGRHLLREDLTALILGELDGDPEDAIADIRERIYNYVRGNRRIMISQLSCDLHCPACPHIKILECYSENHDKVDPE
jgi:hypothetical protein